MPQTIVGTSFQLRPWRSTDRSSLIAHANNVNIARNLSGVFPHPYSGEHADEWLRVAAAEPAPEGIYAIDVAGEAAGAFVIVRGRNTDCLGAELGVWLGEVFWGRGIVSEAVRLVSDAAFATTDLVRLFAPVASWNAASMRTLERNGFEREAVLRRAGYVDGVVYDRVIFAKTRESGHVYVRAALALEERSPRGRRSSDTNAP